MKHLIIPIILFILACGLHAQNSAPELSNIVVSQANDGSKIVTISYDVADADGDTLTVSLEVSDDDGVTWTILPDSEDLSGDVGAEVLPGTGKTITWDASGLSLEGSQYRFKVIADDGQGGEPGFVLVPAGTFMMGRAGVAEPVHEVTLSSFYIGTCEVTHQEVIEVYNWAYQQGYVNCSSSTVTNATGNQQELLDLDDGQEAIDWNGSQFVFSGSSYALDVQCPVIEITWYGCVAYCNYLSLKEGLTPCYNLSNWSCDFNASGYRLPTEAEWEYSARGAANTPDYLYAGSDNIGDVAWYNDNSSSRNHPVGQKQANGIGTYDQSGNAWEWCWDWYDANYYDVSPQYNPTGPATGSNRLIRGGCWGGYTGNCEVAYRQLYVPTFSSSDFGFRLAKRAEPVVEYEEVLIDGGSFEMGEAGIAEPVHTVTVDDFYLGNTEITHAQFIEFLNGAGVQSDGTLNGNAIIDIASEYCAIDYTTQFEFVGSGRAAMEKCPILLVTWFGAVEYCNWLSVEDGYDPCYTVSGTTVTCNWNADGYRLPTEAEWEYAARGGDQHDDFDHSGDDILANVGWYSDNSGGTSRPVANRKPNGKGLYDMNGNIWELCWDWWDENYYSSSPDMNPTGPASGTSRLCRGGSWGSGSEGCRVFNRDSGGPPTSSFGSIGFRIARRAEPVVEYEEVLIDGGSFEMGSNDGETNEQPVHTVIVDDFYLGNTEITHAQFVEFLNGTGVASNGSFNGNELIDMDHADCAIDYTTEFEFVGSQYAAMEDCPIIYVSWYGAVEYCNWLSVQDGYDPCYTVNGTTITCNWNADGYRLPTEAEWEYAAKGGDLHEGFTYSGDNLLANVGWYDGNAGGYSHPVANRKPNGKGLYDMSGNIYNWCWDWWSSSYYSSSPSYTPLGPDSDSERVRRGGYWGNNANRCTVTYRAHNAPSFTSYYLGFRIARSASDNLYGFAYVPAGTFWMGDEHDIGQAHEQPVHQVTLDAFYIGRHEVTTQEVLDVFNWAYQQGYVSCSTSSVVNAQGIQKELLDMNDTRIAMIWNGNQLVFNSNTYASSPLCPAFEITWYGGMAYCNFKSLQDGLSPCYDFTTWSCNWEAEGYRLPTEAEWEYAARAATNDPDYIYSGSDTITDVGWYSGNTAGTSHPVGQKDPNGLYLYDMSGNVFEWCWDIYASDYYDNSPLVNPRGASSGIYIIQRGGGFLYGESFSRVADRDINSQNDSSGPCNGFRIVKKAE